MYAIDALKIVAKRSNVPLVRIGRELDVAENYVAKIATRRSNPQCDTMARMLNVCGYGLYAIPHGEQPQNAIEITADSEQ